MEPELIYSWIALISASNGHEYNGEGCHLAISAVVLLLALTVVSITGPAGFLVDSCSICTGLIWPE